MNVEQLSVYVQSFIHFPASPDGFQLLVKAKTPDLIWTVEPDRHEIFGANASITGQGKFQISDILPGIMCTVSVSAECAYQILVIKMYNGGRISYILRNLIPNISALSSKHFTC